MSPGNAAAPGRSTEGGAKNTGEAFTQKYSNHPVAGRLILPGKLAGQLGDLAARIDRLTVRVGRLEQLVEQLLRDGSHTVGVGHVPDSAIRVAGPAWVDHLAELRTGWTYCGRRFDTAVRRPDGTRPLCKNCCKFAAKAVQP